MDPATVQAWIQIVWQLGLGFTVACVAFIWLLFKGIVTWGWQTDAERLEKLQWRQVALDGKIILRKIVEREERAL